MRLSIIIPAHNEEERIVRTLRMYSQFLNAMAEEDTFKFELLVVLNGCTDNTSGVLNAIAEDDSAIHILELEEAGKGRAVREGFIDALTRPNTLIGFVDADMATKPEYFYELVTNIGKADGIIASRYAPGAHLDPPRPWYKRLGSRLVYDPLVRLLLGLNYYDTQCGAKLFTKKVIGAVLPDMKINDWGFDVELLYLCKKQGFTVIEHPTTWYDQAGSKLETMGAGFKMITDLFAIRAQLRGSNKSDG